MIGLKIAWQELRIACLLVTLLKFFSITVKKSILFCLLTKASIFGLVYWRQPEVLEEPR